MPPHSVKLFCLLTVLRQLVLDGGPELLNELCLASYCPLGECVTTRGYLLPAHSIYHCVFGDLEDNLQQSIWCALDRGCLEKTATISISIWLDGFAVFNVSPHCIIESVRQWLQQCGNSNKYTRITFLAAADLKMLMNRYFPQAYYCFSSRSVVSDMRDVPPDACDKRLTVGAKEHKESTCGDPGQSVAVSPHSPCDCSPFTRKQVTPASSSAGTLYSQRLETDV
jgi:hypothetical protein